MPDFPHDARDPNYWQLRSGMVYYRRVAEVVESLGCRGSLLDVGCCTTGLILCGDFARRVSVDLLERPALPGVEAIVGDYLATSFPVPFDVAICCQVLEHAAQPGRMIRKLFAESRWPHRLGHPHVHDPIDREKLNGWARREPEFDEEITEPGRRLGRLLAVYRGDCE